MNGLPFERLPATQENPVDILQNNYAQTQQYLKSQYDNELNAIQNQFLTDEQFNDQVNRLNAKYQGIINRENFKVQQQVQEIQRIQALVDAGQITPDAGNEAMWRMVLPPEIEKALFQAEKKPPTILSAAQITSPAMMKFISQLVEPAPTVHQFWTRRENEPKTRQGLIDQYLKYREAVGYGLKNIWVQRQLDMMWDSAMRADERCKNWWIDPDEKRTPIPEVQGYRAKGKIAEIMKQRMIGAPIAPVNTMTPLATSVQQSIKIPKTRPEKKILTKTIAAQYLRKYDGNRVQAMIAARRDGYVE